MSQGARALVLLIFSFVFLNMTCVCSRVSSVAADVRRLESKVGDRCRCR